MAKLRHQEKARVSNDKELPLIKADQDGIVTFINQEFEQTFGWAAGDIVGKTLTVIIPPHLRDAHNLGFSRFLTTGSPTLLNQPLSLQILTRDGHVLDAEHFITAEDKDGQWVFAATITPREQLGR